MMNPPRKNAKFFIASVASLSLGFLAAQEASATSYTFTGTGEWYAANNTNWNPTVTNGLTNSFLNTAGNSVTINGVVDYNSGSAGGDFMVGSGDTMTIDGSNGTASWTQALGTNNWCKIGTSGGSSVVSTVDVLNGGTFNMLCNGQELRLGLDGGAGSLIIESTAGGLNIAGTTGGVAYSNSLQIAAGSTASLLGGTNSIGEIVSSGMVTFGGGSTTTTTTGQWDNETGAVYNLSGGTVTATNYDMTAAGTAFNVSGGSVNFTGNFTNLGAVTMTGGSVSVAGTFNTTASTNVNISAGTMTKSGSGNVFLNYSSTFTLSGTAQFNMTGSGEFQPGYTYGGSNVQGISGGAAINVAGLVAFQGGATTRFDINGGSVTIGSSSYNGIYSSGGYFNFTTNSTGDIILTNVSVTNAIADITGGKVRYNDTTYTSANYTTEFTVIPDPANPLGGSEIELLGGGAVPEPSTWLGGGLLMGVLAFSKRVRAVLSLGVLRKAFGC